MGANLLDFGGNLLSAGIGAISGAIQNRKQIKAAKEMQQRAQEFTTSERLAQQDYQTGERKSAQFYNTQERVATQQWNLEMWNRQNEYNSPAAQLERLQAAGINPNTAAAVTSGASDAGGLMSSPASSSGGPAPSGAPSPAPSINAVDVGSHVQAGINALFDNELKKAQTEGQNIDNANKPDIYELTKHQYKATIRDLESNASFKDAERALTDEQRRQLHDLFPILRTQNVLNLHRTYQGIQLAVEEINNAKATNNLIKQQEKTAAAQEDLLNAQEGQVAATTEQINSQTEGIKAENVVKKLKASLSEKYGLILDEGVLGAAVSLSLSGEAGAAAVDQLFKTGSKIVKQFEPQNKKSEPQWLNHTPLGHIVHGAEPAQAFGKFLLQNPSMSAPAYWPLYYNMMFGR